ncbi:MAG: hypothetical protein AAGD25_19515 [Cyanobacteria bacterium P01_F01_bin.150]
MTAKSINWTVVCLSVMAIALFHTLTLYPQPTMDGVQLALRGTALTTSLSFLLFFVARPLILVNRRLMYWAQTYRPELWLILTASHLLHLYEISLYYQLGQQCPLVIWLATIPVWVITVLFAIIEIIRRGWFEQTSFAGQKWMFRIGLTYVWLIFTTAFGLGTIAQHLLIYNTPLFILFLAGSALHGIAWFKFDYRH